MELEPQRFERLPAPLGGPVVGVGGGPPQRVVPAKLLPAVAATSFVCGAAIASYAARKRRGREEAHSRRLEVVGSRSLLLDVHLLGRGGR